MIGSAREGGRRCASCGTMLAINNTASMCGRCHRERRDELDKPPILSEDFFDTDEFRAAFASHHIGTVFKVYRNHRIHFKVYGKAISQELLGRWLRLNQAQVSRLENGRPEQNIETLCGYAETLHLPRSMLWWDFPGQHRLSGRLDVTARPGDRLSTASDESSEFLAWAESNNVSEMTVDQIHDEIRSVAHSYLKASTMPLFERTCKLRDRVFRLLSVHPKPAQSRDLYSAAGWSLTVLAWISTDLGRPEMAEKHLEAAWLCAENAEQNNLRAWVRATQHTAAFWQNDFLRAAHYAQDGLRYATNGTAELYLASAWALNLAHFGDHENSRNVLKRAQIAAESVGNSSSCDELRGPFTCLASRAGGFWSDTHLALGDASQALYYADRAVSTFESTSIESRNFGSERMVRCQQVKAHLMLGEFDGAAEKLDPVLATAPEHRVGPLARRVDDIKTLAVSRGIEKKTPLIVQIEDATVEFQRKRYRPVASLPPSKEA